MGSINVYQMVTNRIIEELNKGIIPWRQTWVGNPDEAPVNYVSRRPYSGINLLLLPSGGEFLTFKQVGDCGGRIRKGAKSSIVVFFTPVTEKVKQPDGTISEVYKYSLLRYYNVFNIKDTEGIESKNQPIALNPNAHPIDDAEAVVEEYLDRELTLKIEEGQEALYNLTTDTVKIPDIDKFETEQEYYSSLFHELTHSTMKDTRCDRQVKVSDKGEYSREELVAEIGSAMLLNRIGIEVRTTFQNSVAYIQNWVKALQNDEKMIVWAASRAEAAARYILGEQEGQ